MEIKMIQFQPHGDERGMLIALEEKKNIPFEVKRVYFMYDTVAGVHRGNGGAQRSGNGGRAFGVCVPGRGAAR